MFVCLNLALTTIVFAGVRVITRVPSAPFMVEVTDIWRDGCQLKYQRPIYDGGTPIIGYIIECRNYKWIWLEWKLVGTSKTLQFTVDKMQEGSTVEFRVKTVNGTGESEPSQPSALVTFKDFQ